MPNWRTGENVRRATHAMTQRLRYEVGRAMDPVALQGFMQELFHHIGPPSLADIMYVVQRQTYHFVQDSHGRIALTAEFAYSAIEWPPWRQRPWPERQCPLSRGNMIAISTAVTRILLGAKCKLMRGDVLYYHVREAFSSVQPPSRKDFLQALAANEDVYSQDSEGYIHLLQAYRQSAPDGAAGEEQQSSKPAQLCIADLAC